MKRGGILLIVLILLIPLVVFANEEQEAQQEQLQPAQISGLNHEDIVKNLDQISANPALSNQLSSDQISELNQDVGYDKIKSSGLLKNLNDAQVLDSGIIDSELGKGNEVDLADFNEDFREDIAAEILDADEVNMEGGNTVLKKSGDSVSLSATNANVKIQNQGTTFDLENTNGEITINNDGKGGSTAKIDGTADRTDMNIDPGAENREAQPAITDDELKNEQSDVLVGEQNLNDENQDSSDIGGDTDAPITSQGRVVKSVNIIGGSGIFVSRDTITVDSADSIILRTEGGNIEISSDVENFYSDGAGFSVGRASLVTVDGVQVENPRNTRFLRTNRNGSNFLQIEMDGILDILDNAGTQTRFESDDGGGKLLVDFDTEEVDYVVGSGEFNVTPDVPSDGETYTESINAQGSEAEAKVTKANGVTYLKLTPPASYTYTPESLEKTFSLQAQHEVHEVFFSKGGDRPKNGCQKCTVVDFVDNMIKINGRLTYKRYFFEMQGKNPNLMEPTLQDVFIPENPVYAILTYDEKRRFIDTLSIRENKGEFKVIPTNYINFRFQGKVNGDNVQGEVFFRMKPVKIQFAATPIFHNIINVGNTPIRYIDDPRSSEKVLAQGSVFYYPTNHQGIKPFINELEQTCVLPP